MPTSYADMARSMANIRHEGQKDLAGEYYFAHLDRVAKRMNTDEEKTVAYLHDILEDYDHTGVTEDDLRKFFPKETVDAVVALTRRPKDDYFDYILRLKGNPLARAVKIADLIDNSNLSRLPVVTIKDVGRQGKYNRALILLLEKD